MMRNAESDTPSLFERCFAAMFSGMAAGITYAVWAFFRAGHWGVEEIAGAKDMGKWAVLAGAVLGFFGGITLVTSLWGRLWETRNGPLITMETALVLVVLGSIGYWVLR